MPRLGETAAMLKRLRQEARSFGGSRADQGGGLTTAAFSPNPGGLRLMRYAPEGLGVGAPLVVALHGCGQSAAGYAQGSGWLELADRCGFAVLAPEQTVANNANGCFNWFEPGDVSRGQGEAKSIHAMILATVASLRCDPSQIYVTGLSAGGAMAAAMLACYPEVFAGGSIVAGLPYGAAAGLPEALSAMFGARTSRASELGDRIRNAAPATPRPPRVIVWHGDADHTVNPSNAREIVKQWTSAHGVTETADHVDHPAGRTRSRWVSPKTGAVVIECNLVHGMGHGTPLSTQGPEGLGTPGPFMLEVGVSGALETAAFWGLARSGAGTTAGASTSEPRPGRAPQSAASASALGDQVMASLGERLPPEVGRVIERALKAAGLRR